MQTSREVVNKILRKNGKPERVALMEGPWADTVAAWVRQGYPTRMVFKKKGQDRWRREDGMSEEVLEDGEYEEPVPVWEHFGFDMVGTAGWFDVMPFIDYEELLEETDAWTVKRNGAGAALKYWKHKSGTPEHVDFLMTSREIWERDYREHIVRWDEARMVDVEEQRENTLQAQKVDRWVHYGHMFIWECMRQSMGDVTMYESLVLDPEWVHDYNRVYTDLYKKAFGYLFEHIGFPDGVWLYEDMGYKNGLFASPRLLEKLIFPYYAELVEFFHSKNLPVVLHTCGSTAEAMPLIIDAGFDAVNPMERKAKDNDPFVFAEKYGDRLAFVGGLDARIFESNDKDLVRKEIAHYIDGMKARGARLVFASDHSLSTNVRYDTYRYAVDVYREHMFY
jgi:uroporphyrinogen decarboxylase